MARPDVKPGERWFYQRVDLRTDTVVESYELRVSFVSKEAIHGVVRRLSGPKRPATRLGSVPTLSMDAEGEADATWTSEWNSVSTADGAVISPHLGVFRFPLKPGNAHRSHYELRRPREGTRGQTGDQDVRVRNWEEIVVPAGKFRALRIEATGHYRLLDADSRGIEQTVCWYVPEVKRFARCTYETRHIRRAEELVAFEVR